MDGGASPRRLASCLGRHTHGSCPVGTLGAEDIREASSALAAGLAKNATLTHLVLGRSYVRERAVGGVGAPRSRMFVGEDLGVAEVANALKAHPKLTRLDMSVDRRDFDAVSALQRLILFRCSPDYGWPKFRCPLPLAMPRPGPRKGASMILQRESV